ncbi:MAG: hypothetical protein KF866_01175 [Phycisphaeraceae bacterium]|nr:hypothetical protein [Phycisphaeraceae bacterium]MCW5755048.1 hypothetical protein [Phycisphaeraceae bacterium]
MAVRLGDLLVQRGVLTGAQRDQIVEVQLTSGRPFGELAERLFGVSPSAIEGAWATQYAMLAPKIDPRLRVPSAKVLGLVERRQAWQFGVLPIEFEGHDLVVCTTEAHLARALRFCGWRIVHPCSFVITDLATLGEALDLHYPMAGMSADDLVQVMQRRWAS